MDYFIFNGALEKRTTEYVYFFISAMWFIFLIYLTYELFFSLSRRKSVMKWVRGVLWPGLKNKSVVRKSYALSNISIILGAVAGLLSLSKVYWVICSLFFILQLFFSASSLVAFILKYKKDISHDKLKYGVLFSFIISVIGVASNVLSRSFITTTFEIYPDKLPTITLVINWYLFFLIFTYSFHMVILFMSDEFIKGRNVINKYLHSIILSVSISSVTFAGVLYVNNVIILNWLVSFSYLSDTLPVYRCNGVSADKSKYGDKAGFVNITDDLYRVIYFKRGVIESEDVKCK